MGEEDLLGQWKSALELSQHQSEEVGEELRFLTSQVSYPHPCSHKPELPLWAWKLLNSVGLHWSVLLSVCVWDTGKWNWVSMTGQLQCISPNTSLQLFFPAWISCISLCIVLSLSLWAVPVSGTCLLAELLAVLNSPGWASSLLQYVILAWAAMPLLVLDYTDDCWPS